MTCVFCLENYSVLQNKRELASASSWVVVLKSEISQNFSEIIEEIEKRVEFLG